MKIGIVGQFGFGNVGDEGILQAIMDSLGVENEFIVATNLPFNLIEEYHRKIPAVTEVRTLDDTRVDYDALIYGGGKVDWGFGWGCFMRAISNTIPTMAYGVGFMPAPHRLGDLCRDFLLLLDSISVRGLDSHYFLGNIEVYANTLTACPAFNLKEEKAGCLEGKIAVCPRYGDYNVNGEVNNNVQVEWLVQRLAPVDKGDIMLIPFYPMDLEGHPRDLEICQQVNKRLGGGINIFPCNGYNARKVKYAISKSRLVISGGRYHAIVWAMAHGIPYEIAPTVVGIAKAKLDDLVETRPTAEMEKLNKQMFEAIL